MQAVSETNPDFAMGASHPAGVRLSKSELMRVFAAESGRLKRIIAAMGLLATDGEDVLQDVSVKAMQQKAVFESQEDVVRWLIKVTVNRCLAEHRRRRSFSRHAREVLKRRRQAKTASKATDEKVIKAEELEIVRESLRALDDCLLGPMVLGYFCGLSSKEGYTGILGTHPTFFCLYWSS
jgi:DNA-directed RNA polymerase specialized sigma24 family protein